MFPSGSCYSCPWITGRKTPALEPHGSNRQLVALTFSLEAVTQFSSRSSGSNLHHFAHTGLMGLTYRSPSPGSCKSFHPGLGHSWVSAMSASNKSQRKQPVHTSRHVCACQDPQGGLYRVYKWTLITQGTFCDVCLIC